MSCGRGGGEYGGRGEYGGGGMYGGRGEFGSGSGVELKSFEWDHKTESVLLRFFDNTVLPGHRYRYRVQLALLDVNNNKDVMYLGTTIPGIPVKYLDKSVTERRDQLNDKLKGFRLTEWSKASPSRAYRCQHDSIW